MKLPECERCCFYAFSDQVVCAVHPAGPDSDSCLDFRPRKEELWEPVGASYYDGELILHRPPRYTPEEQLWLLDNHPWFTGECPECGYQFGEQNPPPPHWDCPRCGWRDDTV